MVEASASRVADPRFDSHLRLWEFSGVCPWGARPLPRVVLGGQCSTVRVILCCLRCTVSRVVVFQEKCDTTRVSVPSLKYADHRICVSLCWGRLCGGTFLRVCNDDDGGNGNNKNNNSYKSNDTDAIIIIVKYL